MASMTSRENLEKSSLKIQPRTELRRIHEKQRFALQNGEFDKATENKNIDVTILYAAYMKEPLGFVLRSKCLSQLFDNGSK